MTSDLPQIEQFLQDHIFPDLENGRPNWDKPHTISVVQKVKDIIANTPSLKVDSTVLIIAAYAHDWGYANLFENGSPAQTQEVNKVKEIHMQIGGTKITNLLKEKIFDSLTSSQKQRIIHLVSIHDMVDKLKDPDELTLMEADTLGVLDISMVKPTYDKQSNDNYLIKMKANRLPRFINDYSKKLAVKFIEQRDIYYQQLQNK